MSAVLAQSQRQNLLSDVQFGIALPRRTASLLATIIAGGAVYGAALGAWHGSLLSLYAAVKVPILLIGTAAITALFNWIVAAMLALPMRLAQTFALSLMPLAIAAMIAASVAPPLLLFAWSLPAPAPDQRTTHNILYLLHVLVIAGAGMAGTAKLGEVLLSVCGGRASVALRVRLAWIAAYALVAGELAWALRPFVGSVYFPVVFLRRDALRGNVYEFIFTDILPHLWRTLT